MDRIPNILHSIRIHAAWERVELGVGSELGPATKITLPDTKAFALSADTVVYSRKFNLPSGLNDNQRVELECSLLGVASDATLNGVPLLLAAGKTRFDVTSTLRPHNLIRLAIPLRGIAIADLAIARLLILES